MVSSFIGLLDIQSWWEIPCIAHFCSLFRTSFNLPDIDIEDFEAALLTDGTDDAVDLLPELIVELLKGCLTKCKHDITTSSYQMFLRRFFRYKCRQHNSENYFNTDTDFQSLPVRNKLLILYTLCHFRLECSDVINKFNNLEAKSLRVEPLGYDSNNSGYWYFFGTRLYREDYRKYSNNSVWQVICFTEEDWKNLARKFKRTTNRKERALLDILRNHFLPKLPHLFREKEKLRRKKLFQERNSARLRSIAEIKQNQLNEQQEIIDSIEQERINFEERLNFEELITTSKRRRSQSTSTASGISTYASSIQPSINSSDFLYKREKFGLSPDLCGGSVSTPPSLLPNINQQLFPPTPSQSPVPLLSQINHKTTDYSDNNEDLELENNIFDNNSDNLINENPKINQNIIIDDDKSKIINNNEEILLIKNKNFNKNQILENNSIKLLNNLPIINNSIKWICAPEETDNNKLNKYKNDDTISVSSIEEEEDKENFIFYKRSNTSDTTAEESCGSSSLSEGDNIVEKRISTIITNNKKVNKKKLKKSTIGENIMAPTTNMKLPGRQTNNSLSSLSGNIFLPPFEGSKTIKSEISTGKISGKKEKSTTTTTLSTSLSGNMAGSSSNQDSTNTGSNKKKKSKSNEIAAVTIKKACTLSTVALTTTNNCLTLQQNQQTQNPFLSFTETDEVLQIGMHKVLVHVKNHRDAWPFMDPVEEDIAPRYYSIIRRPMDLLKMEDKLDNGEYTKFSEFRNDFKLIVNNCRLYNGQNNEYTEMVNNLQEAFDKATKKYFDHYSDEDDETNLGYLDTKLNVFREKLYNKSSTTILTQSDDDNNDDDNNDTNLSTSKIIQQEKIKDKYKENTSGKHYYKHNENINNDDDIDSKMNDNIEVQNDFKTNKRKRKDKDKRRKKKLKLESIANDSIDDNEKYNRIESDCDEDDQHNKLNISNENQKNHFQENEKLNEDIIIKTKNKKSKKNIETNMEIMKKSTISKKISKKKIETKTKEIKSKNNETKLKNHSKNDDIIVSDVNDVNDDIITEKKISKKLKTKNPNKMTKVSKSKTTNHKYSNSENDDVRGDQEDQNYDYNSDNSYNSNKNRNSKRRSSLNSSSILSSSQKIVENSKIKKIESETIHLPQPTKTKKDKRNTGGNSNNSPPIKDSKKASISQEDIVPVLHNKKKKNVNKNHKSHEGIADIIQSKIKRQSKNKNNENINKIFGKNDESDDNKSIGDRNSNISDCENDSLMSLSSSHSPSRIFKVDLHKKYAKSASLDDNNDFVINEKEENSFKKSSTKLNSKLLKNNNNNNSSLNNGEDDDNQSLLSNQSLMARSSSPFIEQPQNSKSLSTTTTTQGKITNKISSKKKSKSIKNKSKSIKTIIQNEDKINCNKTLLPVNSSISSSNSSLNNKETDNHEKSLNNINGPELETSSSHSLLFLDKYDLIKQRRSRANNSASTPEEKWNQIVKEAAEKNKDNKKNSTSSNSGKNCNTNTTSNKDKNQKLKETIAKLKVKNEKSKERSVLIDEIFGVKPTQEIRDEKTIFEKLRETCLDTGNKSVSNAIIKSTNSNKKSNTENGKAKNIKSQKKSEIKELNSKVTKKKITKPNDKKSQARKQTTQLVNSVTNATTSTKKKSQSNNKTNMEALELETEQTLKDINRWLEHTPRFSEFSSASNSPTRYNLLDDFDAVAAKLDPNDFRRPVSQAVAAAAAAAATASSTPGTLTATVPPTKTTSNTPKLIETFEETSTSYSAVPSVGALAANISKSPSQDEPKLLTDLLPSPTVSNKINIAASKEELSQSSSNATINSSSNQSSISTMPSIVNATFTSTTVKTTKEPSITQLLPHPPPPPPNVKSQLQKEAKRKTLKEKLTGQGNNRRKDTVRTMDRFQPGKSKGNLLSNTNHSKSGSTNATGNDEIFPLSSSVVSKLKEVKNSLVVKTDESAPKLSLGSVLHTEGFGLGQLHNFGDEISCGELKISDAITSGDENDDKKKIDNLTISSSSPSDCGSKDTITLSDDKPKCDDLKETQTVKNENESETSKPEIKSETKSTTSATPNLSAWFKAFGAPKKTKKQEEEEAIAAAAKKNESSDNNNSNEITKSSVPLSSSTSTDHGNCTTFNSLKSPVQSTNETFSLPAPRQRKASTGSTISERSSFSQDPDSPRIGIDDRFGTYPGPYASPIGASPIMVSPKPDEIVKPTSPYPLNGAIKVGFYQDTTTKSSPEKSCSPRELPSPAYPQYSQHIYTSTTSPNVTTDLTSTSNTTPITTSPYGAGGGSSNSSTNNNTGCYNPSVDPNKTPTGSSTIYSPTSPVTPATPNLYEQYKQPHSQESDYNSSMSPSTNPNSPYQQPQSSPYQHHPNSPYQQSSNQNSPYQQPNSPYQSQQPTQVQSQQQSVIPSTSNNNANNNNNQSSMPISIHSPGNSGSHSQSLVQQQQQTPQQSEPSSHVENATYPQQSTNSPYQQQSLQSPYQKNQTSPYQQPIPTAHQTITVLPSQQQQQQPQQQQPQQSQLPMNFGQQTLDTNQQHQQRLQQQQKQISPAERQQYPTDTQSRYSNLLENSNQYQHQSQQQQQTSSSIRLPYEQQQTSSADQWKSSQTAATIVQGQNSQAMNLQQQNAMNSMNLPMNSVPVMGSVVDQQQQQLHSLNQMQQQAVKSSSAMQYPNYTQYVAPSEKDNNMHKSQGYGSDLSNHMIHKQNPANILNPLHMQQQPLHQQHPPKRSHPNDTTVASSTASSLMNLGYSEPNSSMSDPKIQKRSNDQQQVDKMFDPTGNTSTLNKHQQMFDSFLGSMGKTLSFGKSLDISTSKAYEMFNKATAMGFHNKDFATNQTRMQSGKDINSENNSGGNNNNNNNNNNLHQNQHNMSNVVSQGKSIDNNSGNNSYQSQQQHSQNQQQQVPSNLFNINNNNNNSGSAGGKHSQQNHPSNYSQNLTSQQNTNEKSHLVIPNPRQDQMSNLGRNMDLSNYKPSSFNNPAMSSSSLLDPLRNINHAMAMLDDNSSMLGLQNPSSISSGNGGYYDKSMPPAAHMFSKNLPQQIYQNPGHYGMVRDQQNPPPPGNYVPSSSSGVTNMSTAALQMEQQQPQQQIPETKPKRGKKKKNIAPPPNDIQNNQLQNSMLSNSQLQQQQLQQQQHQQHMSSHSGNSNNSSSNSQNMINVNQSSVQAAAAAAAHHQGFQLYAGLKNAAAVAAASTSSSPSVVGVGGGAGSGIQTNTTDVSAISLKTATAASMVSGSAFNFGPSATGLGLPTAIYDNSGYLDEFRGAPNPYYMPPSHRVTPDTTGGAVNTGGGLVMDKSINSNNTNPSGTSATAAVAAATSPYHQFLSHQAATQRSSYSFMNSPQLDPNSPLYTQYMRPTPDELRARMIHGLLPGGPTGYSQSGYRPPPTHLGMPKPYDMNRNPWF